MAKDCSKLEQNEAPAQITASGRDLSSELGALSFELATGWQASNWLASLGEERAGKEKREEGRGSGIGGEKAGGQNDGWSVCAASLWLLVWARQTVCGPQSAEQSALCARVHWAPIGHCVWPPFLLAANWAPDLMFIQFVGSPLPAPLLWLHAGGHSALANAPNGSQCAVSAALRWPCCGIFLPAEATMLLRAA